MIRIYKEKLGTDGELTVIKGKVKNILTTQFQPGIGPCVWYEVDDDLKEIEIQIIAIGTGWDLPKNIKYWDYIGTVQDEFGFVWHYYAIHSSDNAIGDSLGNILEAFFGGKE